MTFRPKFTMRFALQSPKLFGSILAGSSWDVWRIILIAAMGEELTPSERAIFTKFTGRAHEPGKRVDELVAVIGRRAGKSRASSVLAAYIAGCCTHKGLAPGERGRLLCLAQNRDQAAVVLNFVAGIFNEVPLLSRMVVNKTAEAISLSNGIDIEVRTASFRGLRGVTSVGVIADECSFWYSEDTGSRNTDTEILGAVRPSLATTGGPLIIISSPQGKSGEVYEAFRKNFGPDGDPRVLVVNGATRDFNPSLPQAVVDRALERDPELNKAEYLGQFRDDITNFIARETLDRAVVPGRFELQPHNGITYVGFVDPSGGSADSFTLAIAHKGQNGKSVLDLTREYRPPFSPAEVVAEICGELKRFGLTIVRGDRYGAEILAERFRDNGIAYRPSDKNKSDLYLELLPLLNSNQVELLEGQRLINQFANLERMVARGGKSTVDHPRNAHDDVANAAAGALVNTIPIGVVEFVFDGIKVGEGWQPEMDWSPIPEGVVDQYAYRMGGRPAKPRPTPSISELIFAGKEVKLYE